MVYQTRDILRQRIVPPVDRNPGAEDVGTVGTGGTGGTVGTVGTGGTGGDGGRMSYREMFEKLNTSPYQSAEDEAKERKREKRQKLFAAIGDGISALSNLYFTTKGAPNMYSPDQTQSGKVATYWDKLRQEREANRRRYVDGYLKASQADDLAAIKKQNADAAQAAKEADAKRKDDLANAQGEVFKARAAKDAAATALSEKTLEYMNSYGWSLERDKAQANIDLMKARERQAVAPSAKLRASSVKTGGGASGGKLRASSVKTGGGASGGKGKYYGTFNGVAYRTKADYDNAVVSYAKANGIPLSYGKKSTDAYGMGHVTQTNRTIPGLAAAGEAHYRKAHAAHSAGGGGARNGTEVAKPVVKPAARHAVKPAAKKTYEHTKALGL